MYGQGAILDPEGLLVPLTYINIMAYVFFDSYPDSSYRGGRKQYMFSLIATKITYFQSLKLKQVFIELSSLYKNQQEWDIEVFWKKMSDILIETTI
ncbi:unnamed protein product [marine sediment metagenome]|uniref:Uncharacterized protein n=1 Tax=marine sediment metagenome TaxID=412755 RepID=X0S741_9ZZZZ